MKSIVSIFLFLSASFAFGAKAAESTASEPIGATPTPSDTVLSLNEITVQSIKAVSRYQFPTTVTMLSENTIERYDVNGLKQLSEIAPNFYMPQYGSRMTSSIYVRGLGSRIDQPVVGLNVDNVPVLNKDAYDFSFPDIVRAEVARGPQSTLYGRNTMGGVINLTTLSPMQFQGLKAQAEYGSANTYRLSAGVYTRPTDKVALAAMGAYYSTDGFFRNLYTGKKIDNERQGLAKIKLAWRPSNSFLLENAAWITVTRQGGFPYQSVETGQINHNDTCFYRRTSVVDGLTMRWFGDKVNISSITSFQYLNDNLTLDQDFLPADYFVLTQKRHEWALTQDLVATGKGEKYNWLAGAFGFVRRTNMTAPVTFHDTGLKQLIEGPMNSAMGGGVMSMRFDERQLLLGSDFLTHNQGWALYHKSQLTLGSLRLSAALRLAWERTAIDYISAASGSLTLYMQAGPTERPIRTIPFAVDLADRLSMHSLQLLPEVKIAYDFCPALSVGFVWAKGYKAGGYNTQMFSDILQQALMESMGDAADYDVDEIISYKPETSWNYELNFSSHLLDNNLNIDLSTFFIDCRNQQMTVFPEGTTTGRMMANAGRTRSVGFELAVDYRINDHWRIDTSYGLASAKFRQFNDGRADYKGNHVPYAPENTLFGAATYTTPLSAGPLTAVEATVGCRGVGKIWWNEANSLSQPFYATMSASVNLRTKWLDVEIWGENLTDTQFSTFYFVSMRNAFVQRGNPRRFGITLRYNLSFK